MNSKKVKILVVYRNQNCHGKDSILEKHDTLFILDESYLLVLLSSLVRQDIERVEVIGYD